MTTHATVASSTVNLDCGLHVPVALPRPFLSISFLHMMNVPGYKDAGAFSFRILAAPSGMLQASTQRGKVVERIQLRKLFES